LFRVISIPEFSVNVIFLLIAVSLLVAIGFLISFIWSIRSGQYDDDYTPSVRILFDDEVIVPAEEPLDTTVKPSENNITDSIDDKPKN